jgi:hypothetical protein
MKWHITILERIIILLAFGCLLGVIFLALNPIVHITKDEDSTRWDDVLLLSHSLMVERVDQQGAFNPEIMALRSDIPYLIGTGERCSDYFGHCFSAPGGPFACVTLSSLLSNKYIKNLPISPSEEVNWSSNVTGYYLIKNSNNTLTVGACEVDGDNEITVTR